MPAPRISRAGGLNRRRPLVALIVLILLLAIGYAVQGTHHDSPRQASPAVSASASAEVALSALPLQARQTVALIQRHGPFPYSQDGVVYRNLERQLPSQPTGYYHEYTVPTPGSSDRGARRIVTGSAGQFYYTGDHYVSFRQVNLDS